MTARLLLISIVLLTGCSKSSPEPEFFMTATVGGSAWVANVANSQNTNVAASANQTVVLVAGVQSADNTNTVIGFSFPKTISLNTAVTFNVGQNVQLAYLLNTTEGYVSDPSQGTTGSLTISRFDQTENVVEGAFTGEFIYRTSTGRYDASKRIKIENGRFRSALYTTSVTTAQPGKR